VINIEAGKYYLDGAGDKVGPMTPYGPTEERLWRDKGPFEGIYSSDGNTQDFLNNLVSEWVDTPKGKKFQDMVTKVGDKLTCVSNQVNALIYTKGETYEVFDKGLQDNHGHGSYCMTTNSTFVPATPEITREEPLAINYNDGKWHEWAGGPIPVHPLSEVHYTMRWGGTDSGDDLAGDLDWVHCGLDHDIVAFRVSKEYVETPTVEIGPVEPKELWFVRDKMGMYLKFTSKPDTRWNEVIHVKEIL